MTQWKWLGHHDPCVNLEGVVLFDRLNHMAQGVDFADQGFIVSPLQQVNGEEVYTRQVVRQLGMVVLLS